MAFHSKLANRNLNEHINSGYDVKIWWTSVQ